MSEKKCFCNGCGREIRLGSVPREDVYIGYKEWGYFSEKDLQIDRFMLCETCYDEMVEKFVIPVTKSDKIEVLQETKSFS